MARLQIVQGATSQSINIFVRDSSSSVGAGLAGVAPAGGSLLSGTKLDYSFAGANAARVNVELAVLATVGSAYSSAGIVQIDNTNMIGWVRIDIPNAALAGSTNRVVSFLLWGGTNMAPTPFEIELTAVNNQSANAFITGVNSLAPPTNWNLLSIDGSGRMDLAKWIGVAPLALSSQQVQAIVSAYASGQAPLQPTVAGRTLDVSAGGEAGVDWANVGGPTTANALTNTTISTTQTVATVTDLTAAQAEPGQASPAANASVVTKIAYLYKAWRNRTTQTATAYKLFNDDAATVDQKATFSDDTVTADRSEIGSGP